MLAREGLENCRTAEVGEKRRRFFGWGDICGREKEAYPSSSCHGTALLCVSWRVT
jgi:hypothetical protein